MPGNAKPKQETIIAYINLALTVVVGIVITLYLNIRSEQFQRQLLELQNKAELANIAITYKNELVDINNLGPATAQNLRFVFCLNSVDPKWNNSINSVLDLEIMIDNPAIENSMQTKKGVCDSNSDNDDAIQITVKSLPPQESIKIRLKPSTNLSLNSKETLTNVYILASESTLAYDGTTAIQAAATETQSNNQLSESEFLSSPLNKALDDYLLNNEFKVADFEVSMACQNCNIDKKDFTLSSFINKEIDQIESVHIIDNLKIRVDITNHFYLPVSVNPDDSEDLYLIAKASTDDQISMVKSDKFEFTTIKTLSEGCVYSRTWVPVSTNIFVLENVSVKPDGCYSIEAMDIFVEKGGTLRIFTLGNNSPINSGIYTSIKNDSIIDFKFLINSIYRVNPGTPIDITFAVASANDPMPTMNAARFNLQVQSVGENPDVLFALAAAGESSTTPLRTQYKHNRTYNVRFEMKAGLIDVYVNDLKVGKRLHIPNGSNVFYIGYNLPIRAGIDIEIIDISINGIRQ